MEIKFEPTPTYSSLTRIEGSLIYLNRIKHSVGFQELVKINLPDGSSRTGQIIQADENATIVQVFEGTEGLEIEIEVEFLNDIFKMPLSSTMKGRTFNGLGEPIDELGKILPEKKVPINPEIMNPIRRERPNLFIQTGFSVIDGLNTLVQGQKLPIFTGSGMPTAKIAGTIAVNSEVKSKQKRLDIVFVALGITVKEGDYFKKLFKESESNITFFSNYASDSVVERLLAPHVGLTYAEYLAFEKNADVFVILHDMLNYSEALREVSTYRKEFPGRRGYPGYLYTDLAQIYERAGGLKEVEGSITIMPIITMPNDDITHPVPDLTGFITEGQLIVSRELFNREIFPPIDPRPSLSRLMKEGIGEGKTREDHSALANQLFAVYAEAQKVAQLAAIAGEESLTSRDAKYLEFGKFFERTFINHQEKRDVIETLEKGWECLTKIPKTDLNRIPKTLIKKYYPVED
jgi:V/A-type H+-transporting ATPase subunit B